MIAIVRPETRLCWFVDALGDVIAGSLSEKPQVAAHVGLSFSAGIAACSPATPAMRIERRGTPQAGLAKWPSAGQHRRIGSIWQWPERSSAAASVHLEPPNADARQMTGSRIPLTLS